MTTVWVVEYSHKHGTDIMVAETEQAARDALADVVTGYWNDVRYEPGVPGSPDDLSTDQVLSIYFGAIGPEENYEISEQLVLSA